VARESYFEEDQRWPSWSQRVGWLATPAVMIFILYQLNVHLFQPVAAGIVTLLLAAVFLTALTVQQRLVVRIGTARAGRLPIPVIPVLQRFRRRGHEQPEDETSDAPAGEKIVLTISYASKGPVSALSPGRRGARTGRRERQIAFDDIENWTTARMPALAVLRGSATTFPVGMHRDAVAVLLADGERLLLPTRSPADFLAALAAAKVDSLRKEEPRTYTREEI